MLKTFFDLLRKFDWAPRIRNILRILFGGALFSAPELGEKLAADPDIIMFLCALVLAAIETVYEIARRKGWTT